MADLTPEQLLVLADAAGLRLLDEDVEPLTQMMGLGSFLAAGICERHPDLQVAFLEANCSWAPWLRWRTRDEFCGEPQTLQQEKWPCPTGNEHRTH